MADSDGLRAVSLFSNCGAGDYGFAKAGFAFEVMAEIEQRRLDVALLNHPNAVGVHGDLRTTIGAVFEAYRQRAGELRPALLAACPPCQGMSSAQSARGQGSDPDAGSRDARNLLVQVIIDAAHELRPKAIVVENVPAFLSRKVRHPYSGEAVSAANLLINSLHESYEAYPLIADLAEFGVPQSRKRCFLTFLDRSEPAMDILERRRWVPYPLPSHDGLAQRPVNMEDALNAFDLPPLDASSPTSACSDIAMHAVPVWPQHRYRMVRAIPPRSGLSAWDNDRCLDCGRDALPTESVRCPACGGILPRPVVLEPGKLEEARLVTGFRTSYRRMKPDQPSATITTASGHVGSDRTIHPWENRVLSPLECALLQTIPATFNWGNSLERWGHTNVRAMIGEAVPPLFTGKHGRILAQLLRGIPPRVALAVNDHRVKTARRTLARSRAQ